MIEGKDFTVIFGNFLGPGDLSSLVYVLLAAVSFAVARFSLVPLLNRAMERTKTQWDDILASKGVFRQLAYLVPALVLYFGVAHYPLFSEEAWQRVILAYIILNAFIIQNRLLMAGHDIYRLSPFSEEHSIKPYIQLARLLVYALGAVAVISVLLNKSPWGILGGIGATAAILILVFRDTILSLIASIQLHANDLVRRGDWIEVPECGADGDVIDIALHTVTVQNFDKTIVTIPTRKLIDDSFKNWRGMLETGGRRIKRSLLIDQTSIRFCDEEMIEKYEGIHLLKPYIKAKRKELEQADIPFGVSGGDDHLPLNHRALTNLGTFRAYIVAYLRKNLKIHQDLTIMVRQLQPTPEGIPLEVYCFYDDTDWVKYEGIQADIFDHLLAILPYFDLKVFQIPTGLDFRTLKE